MGRANCTSPLILLKHLRLGNAHNPQLDDCRHSLQCHGVDDLKGKQNMNEVEREIVKLEEELTQTEMRIDVESLDRIYADDIMVTAPIGICVDKPAVMTEVRQAAEKAEVGRYDKTDLNVRAYGDTAVSSYRMSAEATFEGMEIKRQLCITNVWMKRDGHWQIVARHTASLPNDTPPPTEHL
jgi:ketosteroid isomerase-like protein